MPDAQFMRLALRLARRGSGRTCPNPMVGAVLVKHGAAIGRGWHRRAGGPHAEIEALRDAERKGHSPRGATLYVTLEPCCTHGRTPPCTDAIVAAGIQRVIVGAIDPNPRHAGRGLRLLKRAGIAVERIGRPLDRSRRTAASPALRAGARLAEECARLNEAFNHWIVHRTPFVTVKAAMTLDGKIATASGESKWITGPLARARGMALRRTADAIVVGVNTVLADNPSLTLRPAKTGNIDHRTSNAERRMPGPRRIVLDSLARTPVTAKVVSDAHAALTTVVVSRRAPKNRVKALAKRVQVLAAPGKQAQRLTLNAHLDLPWLLRKLGRDGVTHLLVEGGGEANGSFLLGGLAHRIAFFYAPKILGGRDSRPAVGGPGAGSFGGVLALREVRWKRLGRDLLLTARVD